ncbi:uncharacterized protein LOC144001411 isoform X2 [Festucalex cinctus]
MAYLTSEMALAQTRPPRAVPSAAIGGGSPWTTCDDFSRFPDPHSPRQGPRRLLPGPPKRNRRHDVTHLFGWRLRPGDARSRGCRVGTFANFPPPYPPSSLPATPRGCVKMADDGWGVCSCLGGGVPRALVSCERRADGRQASPVERRLMTSWWCSCHSQFLLTTLCKDSCVCVSKRGSDRMGERHLTAVHPGSKVVSSGGRVSRDLATP